MQKFSDMIDFETWLCGNVKPIYRASVREAAHSVTQTRDRFSNIVRPSIAPHWPLRGSLRFTRQTDGQRFEIVNTRRKWICRKV